MADVGSASDPLLDRTLDHYSVVERIGAGGMGVVHRARDERLDRDRRGNPLDGDRAGRGEGDEAARCRALRTHAGPATIGPV